MVTSRIKRYAGQITGAVIAAGLMYLSLRNVDMSAMAEALRTANYWWFIPILLVTTASHFLRAWRWRMFLDALPAHNGQENLERVTLTETFYSVMIGYMVNNAAPRLGEFARSANLANRTQRRFSGVFGTVVVERILDLLLLIVILAIIAVLVAGSPAAELLLFDPLKQRFGSMTGTDYALGLSILIAIVSGLVLLPRLLRSRARDGASLASRMAPIIESFRGGMATLFTSPHRFGIAVTSVAIWIGYWMMLYLPLHMMHMIEPFGLDLSTGFVLVGIGSLGFVVPAPGGIGAYHYFVIQTLVLLYAVPTDIAAGFAVITHAAQLIFLTLGGALCLFLQGSNLQEMFSSARRAQSEGA